MTPADKRFVSLALDTDMPVLFKQQAKALGSKSGERYRKYSQATTLREAKRLGMSNADIYHDYSHGFIQFPANEPNLPGHVFEAKPLAKSCGYIHVLDEYGLSLKRDACTNQILVRVFNAHGEQSFQRLIKSALESFPEEEVLMDQRTAARFAENSFAKVLNAGTVKVDYSLPPEPIRFEDIIGQPDEAKWREAIDEEWNSMKRFGVFKEVSRAEVKPKQVIDCRWVFK